MVEATIFRSSNGRLCSSDSEEWPVPKSSIANRADGWESPYTISFSVLDSWLAAKIRSIGVEGSIEHLGRLAGGDHDLGAFVGVYGWNDPAATSARWRWLDRVEARAMHYDKLGDLRRAKPSIDDDAWRTRLAR